MTAQNSSHSNASGGEYYLISSDLRESYNQLDKLLADLRHRAEHLPIKHARRMLTNLEERGILTSSQFSDVRKIILDGMNDLKRELADQEIML